MYKHVCVYTYSYIYAGVDVCIYIHTYAKDREETNKRSIIKTGDSSQISLNTFSPYLILYHRPSSSLALISLEYNYYKSTIFDLDYYLL